MRALAFLSLLFLCACGVKLPPVAPEREATAPPPPKLDCSPQEPDCDRQDPHYKPRGK